MATLLQKARAIKVKERASREATKDEVELAVAWAKGELSGQQVAGALGKNEISGATHILFKGMKKYIRDNA